MQPHQLDEIDRAILELVQTDATATLAEIGGIVGLSAAAVQRRLRTHRSTGLIQRSVAVLDPSAVGAPILVLTMVTLERDTSSEIDEFARRISNHPNVQQVFEVAGTYDLALIIVSTDMETYRLVVQELLDSDPNVKRYASHVSLRTLKRSLALPLQ